MKKLRQGRASMAIGTYVGMCGMKSEAIGLIGGGLDFQILD